THLHVLASTHTRTCTHLHALVRTRANMHALGLTCTHLHAHILLGCDLHELTWSHRVA
ncbi:hypothetical protein BDZ97DRAFT_1813905, partial [Flammula alnicola]